MMDQALPRSCGAFMALAALTVSLAFTPVARADITGDGVKIGVLMDMSGPFADSTGKGSVEAATSALAAQIGSCWAEGQALPSGWRRACIG